MKKIKNIWINFINLFNKKQENIEIEQEVSINYQPTEEQLLKKDLLDLSNYLKEGGSVLYQEYIDNYKKGYNYNDLYNNHYIPVTDIYSKIDKDEIKLINKQYAEYLNEELEKQNPEYKNKTLKFLNIKANDLLKKYSEDNKNIERF